MKKVIPVLLFFAASAALSAQDMAVATVRLIRTEPVSGSKLNQAATLIEQQRGQPLSLPEKKQLLDSMIDQILIVQAANDDRNISVSDAEVQQAAMNLLSQQLQASGLIPQGAVLTDRNQYRQVIEQQGVDIAEFELNVRNQLLAEKYISSYNQTAFQAIGTASEQELDQEYQARVSEFVVSDSVWFNQILFKFTTGVPDDDRAARARADEVYRQLTNTQTTFAELVASKSEDEISRARGGLIGPLPKGDPAATQIYGNAFIDSVFGLRVGDTSGVIRSNLGYHIVQITEKKTAQLLPRSNPQVRSYLEQIIYAAKFQRVFQNVSQRIIADLRERATINYIGEYR